MVSREVEMVRLEIIDPISILSDLKGRAIDGFMTDHRPTDVRLRSE